MVTPAGSDPGRQLLKIACCDGRGMKSVYGSIIRKDSGFGTYGHTVSAVNAGIIDGALFYVDGSRWTIVDTFQALDTVFQFYAWHL
jgi:hypothetical protein